MIKHHCSARIIVLGLLVTMGVANAADSAVPDPFQRFNAASTYTINYNDLNAVLDFSVVNSGRSTRTKVAPTVAATGTRVKQNIKRSTVTEANRFFFETYADDEAKRQLLLDIRNSLEKLPTEAPLEYFSRDEQLAYWLNLYNVTLLNEIITIYPERNLKKFLEGRDSVLSRKLLTVAGVPLSLDDIQYTILRQNYDNNPLIMYGLYQGIVGGPNIRKSAYTGANVYRNLENNAKEFVNSNRGTAAKSATVFQVSSLYDRNRVYFRNFESDLKAHLLTLLEGSERGELQGAKSIKPTIDDWTITDLYGTYQRVGGSIASNSAALLDSVVATTEVDHGVSVTSNHSNASAMLTNRALVGDRVSPELQVYLRDINIKQQSTASENSNVTMEELGEFPEVSNVADPTADDSENGDEEQDNP